MWILKIVYTGFLIVLVPAYWRNYGLANFLWFSDIALLTTGIALWTENSLLASTQAVSVGLLETVWLADFVGRLLTGRNVIGLSTYMFDPKIPRWLRALSLFHVVLPFLLGWLVWRLGYDSRAWLVQCVVAAGVLLFCYFFTKPTDNINWVFGPGGKPQTSIPCGWYLLTLLAFLCVCVYLPTHFFLEWLVASQHS